MVGIEALLGAVQPVLRVLIAAGGEPLLVGGAVRDALRGSPPSDCDIEVFGLGAAGLTAALAQLGRVELVGRAFGVAKLRLPGGLSLDVALPQRRTVSGTIGALPEYDPTLTPREACARRDFTCNALAVTVDGTLLDFFGGERDIQAGLLRHTSAAFDEDPLRVLRGVQFAARFGWRFAPETAARCRRLLPQAATLPPERVWGEWQKWAGGEQPSAGLAALVAAGWDALYPELLALHGCAQDPVWHPEGDVFVHTGFVCAAAARLAQRERLPADDRRTLLLAALCHDLGKPSTTVIGQRGRLVSPGHAAAGVPLTAALLRRFGAPQAVIKLVQPLVREHIAHVGAEPSARLVRRLAARLDPATIQQWGWLVEADHSGRPPLEPNNPAAPFVQLAAEQVVLRGRPEPLLLGRHLLERGFVPGLVLGRALRAAYEAQLDGEFADVAGGLEWIAARPDLR